MTAPYIGQKLGVSKVTVSYWENGHREPNDKTVYKLAELLGINVNTISDLSSENIAKKEKNNDLSKYSSSVFDFGHEDTEELIDKYVKRYAEDFKKAIHEINKTAVIMRSILQCTDYAYIYVKDTENRYLVANEGFMGFTDKSSDINILGKTDKYFFNNKQATINCKEDEKVMYSGKPVVRAKRKINGKHLRISKTPVYNKNKNLIGMVATCMDVTDETKANYEKTILQHCVSSTPYIFWFGQDNGKNYETTLRHQYVSGDTKEILGVNFDAWQNDPFYNARLVVKDDKKIYKDFINCNTLPRKEQYRINHSVKGIQWIESSINKIKIDGKSIFFGVVKNITSKKTRRQRLEQLKKVIYNSPDACWIITSKGRIIFANKAVESIYEIPITEFGKKYHIFNFNHPDSESKNDNNVLSKIGEILETNKTSISFEQQIITPNINDKNTNSAQAHITSRKNLDQNNSLHYCQEKYIYVTLHKTETEAETLWCGYIRDITEQKRLRQKVENLEYLLNKSTQAFFTGSFTSDTYHYISDGMEKIYGITKEEFFAHPRMWENLIREDYRQEVLRDENEHIAKKEHFKKQYPIVLRDGTEKWIDIMLHIFPDNTLLGVVTDITEQKKNS
jgi:PAS domain S-box-containing protein